MANSRDFTLKRKNGTIIDTLYPTTRWAQVEEKPTTFTPTSHSHGNITNGGAIGSTANLMVKTGTNGKLTTLPKGTTSQFLRGDGTWATPAASGGGGGTVDWQDVENKPELQDKLVAGDNIIIDENTNVISVSDDLENNIYSYIGDFEDDMLLTLNAGFYNKNEIDLMIGDIESALNAILGV